MCPRILLLARCSLLCAGEALSASMHIAHAAEWESLRPIAGAEGASLAIENARDTNLIHKVTARGVEPVWVALNHAPIRDFELELEFYTPSPANGGVLIHGHQLPLMRDPAQQTFYGYQINLDTTGSGDVGSIVEEHGRAFLMRPGLDAFQTIDPAGWNKVGVTARGGIIEVRLNGIVSGRLHDDRFIAGIIALQAVPSRSGSPAVVEYRNIRVKTDAPETGWRALFDGKTFDGWKVWGSEEWNVADGTIQGRRGPKESEGYLATIETWKDFRVRGQFHMLGDGNYGLFYHSTIKLRPEDGYPLISGVQGEVMPGRPAETGRLYESYRRGWLMPQNHADIGSWALREGEWNEIEIRSLGNHVTTWVNGIRVVDFEDLTPQLFEGSFALQLHTGEGAGIDWRGLYVQEGPVR